MLLESVLCQRRRRFGGLKKPASREDLGPREVRRRGLVMATGAVAKHGGTWKGGIVLSLGYRCRTQQ
jgi:hypothetical protein